MTPFLLAPILTRSRRLEFNCFSFCTFLDAVYFNTLEIKANIDLDKISEEILPSTKQAAKKSPLNFTFPGYSAKTGTRVAGSMFALQARLSPKPSIKKF